MNDIEKMYFNFAARGVEDDIPTKDKIRYTEQYLHSIRTGGSQYSANKEKYLEGRLSELRAEEAKERASYKGTEKFTALSNVESNLNKLLANDNKVKEDLNVSVSPTDTMVNKSFYSTSKPANTPSYMNVADYTIKSFIDFQNRMNKKRLDDFNNLMIKEEALKLLEERLGVEYKEPTVSKDKTFTGFAGENTVNPIGYNRVHTGQKTVLTKDYNDDIMDNNRKTNAVLENGSEKEKNYFARSLDQVLYGNYTDEVTALGTLGQIGLGLLGADLPGDLRDLTYDITHWDGSLKHAFTTLLDAVALLPVVGSVKYVDEAGALAKGLIKNSDEAASVVEGIVKNSDEAASVAEGIVKNSDNVAEKARIASDYKSTSVSKSQKVLTNDEKQFTTKSSGTVKPTQYVRPKINSDDVLNKAKDGEKHAGIYKDALSKSEARLRKSIESHEEQVKIHIEKLNNPEKYDVEWNKKTEQQKQGLIKKWKKDAKRNAEQTEIERRVFDEKFGI